MGRFKVEFVPLMAALALFLALFKSTSGILGMDGCTCGRCRSGHYMNIYTLVETPGFPHRAVKEAVGENVQIISQSLF